MSKFNMLSVDILEDEYMVATIDELTEVTFHSHNVSYTPCMDTVYGCDVLSSSFVNEKDLLSSWQKTDEMIMKHGVLH